MSNFFRFLSGKKKSANRDHVDSKMQTRVKDTDIECKIVHLDGTDFTFYLEKRAYGQKLEDYTFHQIEVNDDKNYFGLQFTDKKNITHWLDIGKKVTKQCEIGPPYTLRFRVKFFSSDPCNQLHDEYTRYLFVQQLKQKLRDGDLVCDDLDLAAEIASLSLQGELGDYDEYEHTPLFISQYRFLPEHQQTEEFELLVISKYSLLSNRNIVPSIADRQFLEKCRTLPDYGVDRHNIKGKNDKDYVLGLTPSGILIYEGNQKIGLFAWNCVTKLSFKKSRFKIVVRDAQEDDQGDLEHTFVFQSVDVAACKQMWKSCVEHHAFFRLEGVRKPPTKFQQIFRLKSRFYASFHTEYQMAVKTTFGTSTRRSSTFTRTPSLRGAPRASFERNEVERRKVQQRNRDRVREENKNLAIQKLNQQGNNLLPSTTPGANANFVKPAPSPTKMNLNTNLQQKATPRSLAPKPAPKLSETNKQRSVDSTTSESSEESEIVKPVLKPKPVHPVAPPKPNNAPRPKLNNGNMHSNVTTQSDSSESSAEDETHNHGLHRAPPPPANNNRPGNAPVPQQRNVKPAPRHYPKDPYAEQIIQV